MVEHTIPDMKQPPPGSARQEEIHRRRLRWLAEQLRELSHGIEAALGRGEEGEDREFALDHLGDLVVTFLDAEKAGSVPRSIGGW